MSATVKDVKMHQQHQNPKTTRLKLSYKDAELIGLIQNISEGDSDSPQSNIYNNYISDNAIGQLNIVLDNNQSTITQDKSSSGQVADMNGYIYLETMKRQLHLRLCRAKKEYEAVAFGMLMQDTMVILLRMQMDLENGVYMYHEEHSSTLTTAYHTYANMDIALEVITTFKDQISKSLLKAENHDCQGIWDLYKPYVRPTVSCFEPIYHS